MLETLSDDWLPERRSSNCALLWTKPQLHFNSHCRPDRSADAWRTQAFGSRSVEHNSVGGRRCAFDLVFKGAMMSGLFKIEESGAVLLFVRQFYGRLSTCSGMKTAKHEIVQREGGPFGACALEHTRGCGCSRHFASNGNLVSGRHSRNVKTDRVEVPCHSERELWAHARIHIHQRNTQFWNQKGIERSTAPKAFDPTFEVWRGRNSSNNGPWRHHFGDHSDVGTSWKRRCKKSREHDTLVDGN